MNFFKILLTLILFLFSTVSYSDNHGTASDAAISDEAKEMLEELDEEVPLNDPFLWHFLKFQDNFNVFLLSRIS
mgnify:CR=1 FL=1